MIFIPIVGMPGAGKSTLTSALTQQLNRSTLKTAYIAAGDVARRLAETDEETRIALTAGDFAPRDKMNEAMIAEIEDAKSGQYDHIILDGYPRYMRQFAQMTEAVPLSQILVLYLGCNDGMAKMRLTLRGRGDDDSATINERLDGFWRETWPLIESINNMDGVSMEHIPIGDEWYQLNQAFNAIVKFKATHNA
jgi:adenylate kinase family enzyme